MLLQVDTTKDHRQRHLPLFYLSATCATIILFFTFFLDWTQTDQLKQQKVSLSEFYIKYPSTSKSANPYNTFSTSSRLDQHYPYHESDTHNNKYSIQKNIYQLWETQPGNPDFPHRESHNKWILMNPNFKYNIGTYKKFISLVKDEFKSTVPEVAEALDLLPSMALKVDFTKYLLLFLNGGSYADIDTAILKPMEDWFDTNRYVGFVIGHKDVERNPEITKFQEFQEWFFKAKARHPILKNLISTIVKTTFDATKSGVKLNRKETIDCKALNLMEWTGSSVLSDVIMSYLNSFHNPTIIDTNPARKSSYKDLIGGPEVPNGKGINWKMFNGADGPIVIEDVVVYPSSTFLQPQNEDGNKNYIDHKFTFDTNMIEDDEYFY